ncbi:uncharacterized protein LACBIDRAFT_333840 [Laccaria bicolor S238N-H82]|uniref:Predicted protein n=1 Tax=Laccaria bicolor (strain S238N-H82 / ATCC MYA-4686) TaxID=486041 RepID=B0DX91_LACBS|nr:uncharacterized protein LACBIDRAFT_333840 [Laccaria bicolor S238N-H82]EDR00795.1 predicted protein [Laccaria bicolor S238N-H82]|eukprot:XP_001888587.1 predicted protein [Laccaria bicolor S238N-H82]
MKFSNPCICSHQSQKKKLSHFKKYWKKDEYNEVVKLIKAKFIERYEFLHRTAPSSEQSKKTKKSHKVNGLICDNIETDLEYEGDEEDNPFSDPTKPWRGEFLRFLNARDVILENMGIIEWWGEHSGTYGQTWTLIARDYLPIMASSISKKDLNGEEILDLDFQADEIVAQADDFSWDQLVLDVDEDDICRPWPEPEPPVAWAQSSGLRFTKPELSKARPKPQLPGQAGPSHH